jgi:hypothetical protein
MDEVAARREPLFVDMAPRIECEPIAPEGESEVILAPLRHSYIAVLGTGLLFGNQCVFYALDRSSAHARQASKDSTR